MIVHDIHNDQEYINNIEYYENLEKQEINLKNLNKGFYLRFLSNPINNDAFLFTDNFIPKGKTFGYFTGDITSKLSETVLPYPSQIDNIGLFINVEKFGNPLNYN